MRPFVVCPVGRGLAATLLVASVTFAAPAVADQYTVQRGDTLSVIAARHGVATQDLAELNGIGNIHRVTAGTVLSIPTPAPSGYEVANGDTLSSIAARFATTVSALVATNGLSNANYLKIGQVLQVPTGAVAPSGTPSSNTYTVKAGDAVSTIAARFGVTSAALAAANAITNINFIKAGKVLSIPSGQATGPSAGRGTEGWPSRLLASPERLGLVPVFEQWGGAYGVPVDLLMAMTWMESRWRNDVVSSAGALGIGQLLPTTVAWLETSVMKESLDPAQPVDNIRMSARYLRWLLDRTGGDELTALAGYYQGLASVRLRGVFTASQTYASAVFALRERHFML